MSRCMTDSYADPILPPIYIIPKTPIILKYAWFPGPYLPTNTMHSLTLVAVLVSTALAIPSKRATTLIPKSVFDSTASLEQYFTYNYPWGGNTHNGPPPPPSMRMIVIC